ncbi:MAG: anhydro-N-acetylmuramic acid kinase, partial [Bacteroidia bacterium]|nr:anhydro-N-acetylmuramic acid kinase [Bacteroidia bacterium]
MKQHSGNRIKVIGMMSGTSLDGMDLAAVEFGFENGNWQFSVAFAETNTY